jgi:hypothetical protein
VLRAVRRYQVARVLATHAAARREPACAGLFDFVLIEVYASADVNAVRASALGRILGALEPFLPVLVRDAARSALDLYALSEQLDDRLARALVLRGSTPAFSAAEYEAAYADCDDRADRMRQIDLFEEAMMRALRAGPPDRRALAGVPVDLPQVHRLLALAERGFRALEAVGDIGPLLQAVRRGEAAYADGVYARERR